jgi:hypothetical protein
MTGRRSSKLQVLIAASKCNASVNADEMRTKRPPQAICRQARYQIVRQKSHFAAQRLDGLYAFLSSYWRIADDLRLSDFPLDLRR